MVNCKDLYWLEHYLIKKAELLLLDEITSDLECESEEEIIKILKELSKSKIIIMITHRLNTATMCDKIFYFEDGKIRHKAIYKDGIILEEEVHENNEIQKISLK